MNKLVEAPEPQRRLRLLLLVAGTQLAALLVVWAPAALLSGAIRADNPLLLAAPVLALGVLYTVWVRRDGRHTFERWLRRADLRARARSAATVTATPSTDPRLRALAELADDLHLGSVTGTPGLTGTAAGGTDGEPGHEVGFGADADGWFVVAEIAPPPGLRGDAATPVELARLTRALLTHPTPPSAVQVVVHTVPPDAGTRSVGTRGRTGVSNGTPSVALIHESYAQLRGARPVAARQYAWLAVRVGVEPLATTGASGEDVRLALLAAANWARHALRRAGLVGQVLDRAGLLDVLATSLHLDSPGGTGRRRTAETWHDWRVGDAVQAVYAVAGWPYRSEIAALSPALVSPTAATTIAVTVRPARSGGDGTGEGVEVRALVRYCAAGSSLRPAARAAVRAGRQSGITLRSLSGDQARAAYASAPTAGGGW